MHPDEFNNLEQEYEVEKKLNEIFIFKKVSNILAPRLEEAGVNYDIEVRFKHLYSIWKKCRIKIVVLMNL